MYRGELSASYADWRETAAAARRKGLEHLVEQHRPAGSADCTGVALCVPALRRDLLAAELRGR